MGNIEKFNHIAGVYDTDERKKVAKAIAEEIRPYALNAANKSAIDYGCGTGLVGLELLDVFSDILFVDASHSMIDIVKAKLNALGANHADCLCSDFTAGYPAQLRTDYMIVAQTLLHIREVELILSQFYAVLNKGGHLLIVDFDKNHAVHSDDVHHGFEQNALISLVEKAGFKNAVSRTFYHGEKMFMNQDASLFILDCTK